MRVLVVDDEPLACDAVVKILRDRPDVTALEVAGDGSQALELCMKQRFDVITLDLHMPEMDGMQVAQRIRQVRPEIPAVIFVTAFDDQAVAAFEHQAADYVLKPFSKDRMHRALDNAKRRTAQERSVALDKIFPRLMAMTQHSTKIAIKTEGQIVFISPNDIISVKAEGNYVLLQQRTGTNVLRDQISALQERLHPFGFVRIHRSVLINSAHVKAMELVGGEYVVHMKNGEQFNVSRSFKKNLKGLAQAWIGVETPAPIQ